MQPVGGGSINETYKLLTDAGEVFFCKINSAANFPQLFSKEAAGLRLIAEQGIIKTPGVVHRLETEDRQLLILEWINTGQRTENFWKTFGTQLAQLHRVSAAQFGLAEDNYMGSVVQTNKQTEDWINFFRTQRLQPLVKKCFDSGLLATKHLRSFENLYQRLPQIFEPELSALLHGDLWSGNFICNEKEEPVLIDPAVYFGHRSVDLGMTTLFGGFRTPFYEAYHHHFPLPKNYEEQWAVCNLYPLLIHLFLFGSGYLPQIENILNAFQ